MQSIYQNNLYRRFSIKEINFVPIMFGVILGFAFLFAFHEIISRIIKGWFTFSHSYSLLIFIICIYMVWLKKDHLNKLQINPNFLSGTCLTIAGCMVLILGRLSNTLILQGIALVFTLLGLVLLVLGPRYFSVLFIPVGYLLLMFSLIEELLGNISIYFQNITAWIAAQLLGAFGMPVLLSKTLIELPHITLEVAKVCNGINHIVALVSLAIPIAIMRQSSIWYKILFILFAFSIGIFANGLRVALIGGWTLYNKNMESIHGPFELLYVSFILVFGLTLLIIPSLLIRRKIVSKVSVKEGQPSKSICLRRSDKLRTLPIAIATIILFLVGFYAHKYKPVPVFLANPLESFPKEIGQWYGENVNDNDWPFKNHNADAKLKRVYRNNSKYSIGLYIAYYYSQNQKKEIINDRLSWLYNRADDQIINSDTRTLHIKKGLPRGLSNQTYKGDKRSFYFWYEIDRKILTGRYKTKLFTLFNNLIKRRSNGAMIVVTVDDNWHKNKEANDHAVKFIQTAFPYIQTHLKTDQ